MSVTATLRILALAGGSNSCLNIIFPQMNVRKDVAFDIV